MGGSLEYVGAVDAAVVVVVVVVVADDDVVEEGVVEEEEEEEEAVEKVEGIPRLPKDDPSGLGLVRTASHAACTSNGSTLPASRVARLYSWSAVRVAKVLL